MKKPWDYTFFIQNSMPVNCHIKKCLLHLSVVKFVLRIATGWLLITDANI